MSSYELFFYKTSSNREIVLEFINSSPYIELTKIHNDLDLLGELGLKLLVTPLVKKIYSNPRIYELRVKSRREIRLLFSFYRPNRIVFLHGFIKKTNKTPIKELRIAIKRSKEFI